MGLVFKQCKFFYRRAKNMADESLNSMPFFCVFFQRNKGLVCFFKTMTCRLIHKQAKGFKVTKGFKGC